MSNAVSNKRYDSMRVGQPSRSRHNDAVATTATIGLHQHRIRAAVEAEEEYTVTLPPCSEAEGMIYTIKATLAGTGICTVADGGDSENTVAHALDADGDAAVMYSDGIYWHTLALVAG